jgi:tape measure domain-containing protein
VAAVEIIVKAVNAVQQFKRVSAATDKLSKAAKRAQQEVERVGKKAKSAGKKIKDGMDKAGRAVKNATDKFKGLKGALLGIGIAEFTRRTIKQAASFEQSQLRLKLLAEQYGEFGRVQRLVGQNAKTFNLSLAESTDAFSDIFARLRPLGISLDEIQSTFQGFNAVAFASGTSADEASAAFRQLSQALGSGRLQGDEFRSISEQLPGILGLVADELNVQVGELKELSKEGKITARVLINSLSKGFDKNKDSIKELIELSPAQQFKALDNRVKGLTTTLGQRMLPAVVPVVDVLTNFVDMLGKLPTAIQGILGTLALAATGFAGLATAANLAGVKLKVFLTLIGKFSLVALPIVGALAAIGDHFDRLKNIDEAFKGESIEKMDQELEKANKELKDLEAAFERVSAMSYFKGQIGDLNDLEKKIEDVSKLIDELTKRRTLVIDIVQKVHTIPGVGDFQVSGPGGRLVPVKKPNEVKPPGEGEDPTKDISARMKTLMMEELALLDRGEKVKAAIKRHDIEMLRIQEDKVPANKAELQQARAVSALHQRLRDIFAENKDKVDELNDALKGMATDVVEAFVDSQEKEVEKVVTKLDRMYDALGQTISNSIVDALTSAVDGTKKLADVAADTLRSVARILMQFGVNSALGALGGMGPEGGFFARMFGGFRANGGSVSAGKSYVVGERGPELFTPSRSGKISASGTFGAANVVVNVDASGTKAQGDQPSSKLLGKLIGAAVQSELVKQKRPGGLLAAS